MMDFNQILLFAGLGLLALVLLFALWGFLGGLKRELKCIAVFIVLLVLSWLVLGDAATILNVEAGQLIADALDIKGNSILTVWDAIVAYAKDMIPNGEALLVEGKETYDLLYSVVSAVCRAAGLLVGTIAILIICPIIRLISHIIGLFVKLIKLIFVRRKSKEAATAAPKAEEQVVVPSTESGFEEAVITKDKNEIVKKPAGKRRLWGAFAATLKGVFVVILICAPLSGLTSILNSVSPETQELVSDLVNGDVEFKVSQSDDPIEMVFDFAEAYDQSALGKFANASGFFFGESFSEGLFEQLLKIETKTQTIYLTEEIEVFVNAVNQLNGKTDLTTLTKAEFSNLIDALKDSKLVIEVMPIAIEYAHSIDDIKQLLVDSKQENAFLALRYNNWRHDIDSVLEAVKEAYDLNLFPLSDLNYLTFDPEELRDVVNCLGDTELMQDALPMGLAIALSMEDIKNLVGEVVISMDDYDVKKELNSIVDIYAKFQKFGITSLDGFDSNEFIKDVLTDEELTDLVFEIINDVIDLQLIQKLAVPLAFGFAEHNESLVKMLEEAGQYDNFFALESEFTLDDLKVYIETAHIALDLIDLSEYPTIKVDYFHFDADKLDEVIDNLFSTEVTSKLFNLAVEVALSMESIKEATNGALNEVDLSGIDWHVELGLIVDIYRSFLDLGFESAEDFNGDMIDLVQELLEDETKFAALTSILETLASTNIYQILAVPAVQGFVDKLIEEKFASFSNIIGLTDLSVDEWKEDFRTILQLAKDVNELKVLDNLNPFDYTKLDIASEDGISNIKAIISAIMNLNVLGNDDTKTKLLFASINQFGWAILPENSSEIVFDWANEEAVLLQLVDVYKSVNDLEEFDIFNVGQTDWAVLLENDAFLDQVVNALEVLVESDIVLELMPGLLDKHLMPILEGTDVGDDTLFQDMLDNLESEELVNEIIKLVDVVKAAIDLNLLKAKSEGLGAIDLTNTEAFKTIISGIFDSKLIQGFEGRIIRIALKMTGILDIEKDSDLYNELVNLDYTGEKEVLIAFIDTLAPVLQDPEFSLIDANGKLVLDLKFWAENEHAQTLLEGIEVLFGSYGEEGYEGSKLIETLLPSIYNKFVVEGNLIPDDFQEIVDILEVSEASGAELVNLLQCLVYIVEEVVALDAQSLVGPEGGNMEISTEAAVKGFSNIIMALHDIELFKGHESEVLAWVVNYVGKSLNIDIEATVYDFSEVNWEEQQFAYIEIIEDLALFLRDNGIETLKDLISFIGDGDFVSTSFITNENAIAVLDILDKIIDIEVIDAIAPLFVKYGVKVIDEAGLDLSYINELTNEELAADLHTFVAIAHKLVEETSIIDMINSNFAGMLPLPKEEVIASIIDQLFELNIITKADGKLLNAILEKVLPNDNSFFLSVEDFEAENIDWSSEKEFIKELVGTVYDLLDVNNITKLSEVREFISEKWYTHPTFLRDETGYVIVNLLRVLQQSQIVANVIDEAYDFGIDKVCGMNLPFSLSYLVGMSSESLIEDLGTIANILDDAIEFGALRYVADQEIRNMDLEILAGIVEQFGDLNIIAENDSNLVDSVYSYAIDTLNKMLGAELEISEEEMNNSSLVAELDVLANVVRSLKGVFDAKDIEHSSDIEQVIRHSQFKTKDFYTEATFDALVEVVRAATDLHFIELVASQLFEYGINKAVDAGFNFSYMLDGQYETELLLEDLDIILDIAKHGYNLGLIDYVFDKTLHTINVDALCDIVDEAVKMNLAELYFHTTLTKTLNYIFKKVNIEVSVTEEEVLREVTLLDEAEAFKGILHSIKNLLDVNELISLDDILSFVKDKGYAKEEVLDVETGLALEALLGSLVDLQSVQLVLPKLLNYATTLVDQFDLGFLVDEFTGAELAQEIKTLAKLIVPAIEAELVGLAFKKPIDELPLYFEKYNEMLSVVQQSIILNEKYANVAEILLNELLSMLKAEGVVTEVQCRGLDFAQEIEQIKSIINGVSNICAENNIKSVKGAKDFIADKIYLRADFFTVSLGVELENIITNVADLETLQIILPNIFDKYIGSVKGIDLSFLVGEFKGVELAEDIKTIAKLIVPAIEAELTSLLFKDQYKEVTINFAKYDEMLDILGNLNIVNKKYAEIVELAANKVLEMIKFEYTVPAELFEGISFASEVDLAREALKGLEAVFEAANLVKVNDVLTLINEKQYTKADFYTVELGQGLAEFISALAEVETVKVMLPRILNYGVDKLSSTMDLSFVKNALTSEEIAEDLKSIANLIVPAIEAGLVDVIFTKDINGLELHFDKYDEMLATISEMNIINKQYPSVAAIVTNLLFKTLNIETEVTKADLVGASFADDVAAIRNILSSLETICDENEIATVEGAKTFINNKLYQRADFFTLTVGEGLENVLTNAAEISFVNEILAEVFDTYLAKVSGIDLSFLIGEFTDEELAGDVKVIAQLFVPAIEAELVNALFKEQYKEVAINFAKYDEILDIVKQLNIVESKYADIASLAINKVIEMLNINESVKADDFANISYASEVDVLKAMLDSVEELFVIHGYASINDVLEAVNSKAYLETEFYDVATGKAIEQIISSLVDSQTVLVMLPRLFNYGMDKVSATLDVSFLRDQLSAAELAEDIKALASLIVPAINAELNKLADVEERADIAFHFDIYDQMLDVVKELNILNKKYPNFAQLAVNKVLTMLGVNEEVSVEELSELTFSAEIENIKALLDNVEALFNEKGYVEVRDIRDMLTNKEYLESEFYTVGVGSVLESLVGSLVDLDLVEVILPYVFNKYVGELTAADLSFLVDQFTGVELAQDVKTLASLIVPAIQATLNNVADKENIADIEFHFDIYNQMLDILAEVNILKEFSPEFAALAINKIFTALGIEEEVTAADCANVTFADEFAAIKSVLSNVESIFVEKGYVRVRDVVSAYTNKAFFEGVYYTETIGYALEGIIDSAVDLEIVEIVLPYVFDKYIGQVSQFDLSFLVGEFSGSELVEDIKTVTDLIVPAINADIVFAVLEQTYGDIVINADVYNNMLDIVSNLNIVNKKYSHVAALIANYILKTAGAEVEVTEADFANASFAADVMQLKEVVTALDSICEANDIDVVYYAIKFIEDKSYNNADFFTIATGEALESIINNAISVSFVNEILAELFDSFVGKVSQIDLSYLVGELSDEELAADVADIASLIVPAIEHEMIQSVLNYLVKEYVIDEARIDAIANIFDVVLSLNIVRENPAELFNVILNKLEVETIDVELDNINWDAEEAILVGIIKEVANGLLVYNLTSLNDVYSYIKDMVNGINVDKIISELKSIARTDVVEHCVNVVELIDQSDLFDELFKPLYNKFVFDKVSDFLGDAADLTEYAKSDLSDDVHSMAVIARSILNIKQIPGSIKETYNYEECVANLETIVLELFSLNYLEVKKFALVELAEKVSNLDLSVIDLGNVNFENEGALYASLVRDLVAIYDETDRFELQIAHLGVTELMAKAISIYQTILQSDLVKELAYWAYVNYGRDAIANIPTIGEYEFTKADIMSLATDFGIALDALLDMGLFSNDGIDFTNRDNTDRLFIILENNFELTEEMAKNINNAKENMYEIGIVPLTYAGISNASEIEAYKHAIELIKSFAEKYADIKDNLNKVTSVEFQEELQDCVSAIFESSILDQILLPIASGVVKVVTRDVVKLTVLDGITGSEFANVVLPEFYGMIDHAKELVLADFTPVINDAEPMIKLLDAIKDSTFFAGHTEEIFKFALYYAGIDVRGIDFSEVVWEDEVEALKLALTLVDPQLENIDIKDTNTFLTSDSLLALSQAATCFEESKLLPLVARKFAEFAFEKVVGNKYPEYIDRLYDVDYTNEALMNDYARLDEVLAILATTGLFETGVDLNQLDPYVELLEIFFELEYSKGMEETIIKDVLDRVEEFDKYEIDYSKVTDWEAEDDAILEIAHEFLAFSKLVHINNITSDDLHNEDVQKQVVRLVDAASRSVLGQQLLPQLYTDYIEPELGSEDYAGIVDLENTNPEDWASEFEKLFDMYNIVSVHGFHDDYSSAEVLELVKIMFGDTASNEGLITVTKDPETWFKKIFDNETVNMPEGNVSVNYENVQDWEQESQKIVTIVEAMDAFQEEGEAFDYANVYESNDAEALEGLMIAVNESESLQSVMYQVVVNAAEDESNATLKANLNALQVNGESFVDIDALAADLADDGIITDTNKWTDEQIALIAATIADFNA